VTAGPGGELLAGLVSDQAASLYARLLHTGELCRGGDRDEALIVRSARLLAALQQWFVLLWNYETTRLGAIENPDPLTTVQRQILRLVAAGKSAEAVARATSTSVRTVRRHVTATRDRLGVTSRFAAGALAAKRGWI